MTGSRSGADSMAAASAARADLEGREASAAINSARKTEALQLPADRAARVERMPDPERRADRVDSAAVAAAEGAAAVTAASGAQEDSEAAGGADAGAATAT